MSFGLKKPCSGCPFRNDIKPYLRRERVEEIINTLVYEQGTFSCHKTNTSNDEGEAVENSDSEHCAGAMILLEKIESPNQMMRIMERLGAYDHTKLDMDAPVYDDACEMIDEAPE